MRYMYKMVLILLPVFMLSLVGCGSSSNSSTADPFKDNTTTDITPTTAQDASVYFTLKPSANIVSSDIGTLTVTASALSLNAISGIDPVTGKPIFVDAGGPIPNLSVTYTVLSGPVTVGYVTPLTDKNGTSIAILNVSKSLSPVNAIIQATTSFAGKTYIAYAQFQINGSDPTALPIPTLNVTLTADQTQVDVNNGTVMLNANLLYGADYLIQRTDGTQSFISRGSYVADQPVTFTVIAGPATITGSTLQTDKNGNSKAILTTGNTLITTNVIVEASTEFDGKTYRAYTTIQIVRGGGVIMFTDAAGASPGSQSNILTPASYSVDPALSSAWSFMQLIPFKVTDSNGNPRVGVPVTLSVYSISALDSSGNPDPSLVKIDFLVLPISEPNQQTITTDSAGQGVFNVSVTLASPDPGGVNTANVVFKAVTNENITIPATPPVTAYVGNMYTLTSKLPPLTIAPQSTSFAAGDAVDATIDFAISGGLSPYKVSSSNSTRVSVSLLADGVTARATLRDASLWAGAVSISATDKAGQIATATLLRQ
jgi:hypothetical protein